MLTELEDNPILRLVINDLQYIENNSDWERVRDSEVSGFVAKSASETGFCKCTYNYGSTPFTSWLRAFSNKYIKALVTECIQKQKRYVVFGSSSGWLVYYGATSFPQLCCIGIEILSSQVNLSTSLAEKYYIKNAEFRCIDSVTYLNEEPKNSVGIAVVCSLCWPNESRFCVFQRLLEVMDIGSIVVTYHKEQVVDVRNWEDGCVTCFSLIEQVNDVKFSWAESGDDNLFIWRKSKCGGFDRNIDVLAYTECVRSNCAAEDSEHATLCLLFN